MVKNYVQNSSLYGVGESVVGQVRKANEDNCGHASTENGELFVVCDGMGGHVGGATASEIGVRSIIDFISRNKMDDKRVLLAEALKFANMQIYGRASEDATLKGMGTTACIVLIQADDIWLAHVGDSRIYLYSAADKFLYRVTKDHSFVQGLVDSGQLDDRDAENHPQKNIIMRALGIKEDMKPEVAPEPMHCAKGDIIMICSDGLSGMIDDVHIEKKIRENKADLADLCQQLIDDANTPDKGKDNITCQLIRFETAAAGAPKHPDFTPKWRRPGSAVAGAATAAVAGPAPAAKPKKMLWIGLAVLVILLAGGIVGGMMSIAKHQRVFKQEAHDEFPQYTLRSDSTQGVDLKAQLRPGVEPIKWTVNSKGVSIDEDGYLHIDSATYEAETVTLIKVKAELREKEYEDSIRVRIKYVRVVEPVGKKKETEDIQEQLKQQQEKLRQEQEKQKQEQLKQQQEKQKQEQLKQQQEKQKQEQLKQQQEQPAQEKLKATKFVVQFYPTRVKPTDPDKTKMKEFNKSGAFELDSEGGKYLVCIFTNGSTVMPPESAFTLIGGTEGITRHKIVNGWYQLWTDETYKGGASLTVKYEGSTFTIKLPIKP